MKMHRLEWGALGAQERGAGGRGPLPTLRLIGLTIHTRSLEWGLPGPTGFYHSCDRTDPVATATKTMLSRTPPPRRGRAS